MITGKSRKLWPPMGVKRWGPCHENICLVDERHWPLNEQEITALTLTSKCFHTPTSYHFAHGRSAIYSWSHRRSNEYIYLLIFAWVKHTHFEQFRWWRPISGKERLTIWIALTGHVAECFRQEAQLPLRNRRQQCISFYVSYFYRRNDLYLRLSPAKPTSDDPANLFRTQRINFSMRPQHVRMTREPVPLSFDVSFPENTCEYPHKLYTVRN